jgi:hypothetical protein
MARGGRRRTFRRDRIAVPVIGRHWTHRVPENHRALDARRSAIAARLGVNAKLCHRWPQIELQLMNGDPAMIDTTRLQIEASAKRFRAHTDGHLGIESAHPAPVLHGGTR